MKDLWRVGPLLQLSWVVAVSTLIPLGIGILLDRWLRTAPLFILIGALVGILAGTVGAVRITLKSIDALSPPDRDNLPAGHPGEPAEKEDQP
jgi:F0F1-type ATP synthase assembly protein I